MGSRIMHLLIANKIADRMNIDDKTSFLIGGIAADAASPKEKSHFYCGNLEDYSRKIDYDTFYKKYQTHKTTSFFLGYYSHLIADHIWLTGFYLPWLKNRMEEDIDIFRDYHHDFKMLNAKLINYYSASEQLIKDIEKDWCMFKMDEVNREEVEAFIRSVLGDIDYDKEDLTYELRVFTFEQMIGYVETSTNIGIHYIEKALQKEIRV